MVDADRSTRLMMTLLRFADDVLLGLRGRALDEAAVKQAILPLENALVGKIGEDGLQHQRTAKIIDLLAVDAKKLVEDERAGEIIQWVGNMMIEGFNREDVATVLCSMAGSLLNDSVQRKEDGRS